MHVSPLDGVSIGEFKMVIILLGTSYIQEDLWSLNAEKLLFQTAIEHFLRIEAILNSIC